MFDRFVIRGGDVSHTHRHEIHEHRAPTDESVRLLQEMETKALQKILDSVRLTGVDIECVIHHARDDMGDRGRFMIQYMINRRRITVPVDVDLWRAADPLSRKEMVAKALVGALSENIAVQLLSDVAKDLAKFEWSF